MGKKIRWILAGAALLFLCSVLFVGAMAETSGTCGTGITWVLDDEGTLTILADADGML